MLGGGGGGGKEGDIFHLLILLKINRTCEYLQLEIKIEPLHF